jgi:NAD(P)H dehydrogenase (quinone)
MQQLVITGASGQLGRRTAEHALALVEPQELILVTRRPDLLSDLAARGAQVRFGDFDDPASLLTAFHGAQHLLLISAVDLARRVAQHRAAIDAAVAIGIRRIVYTSMISPQAPNPAAVAPSHWQTEAALRQCGAAWTLLRNSLYADYQLPEAQQAIQRGHFLHNRGTGRIAYVAREDCAAVAAAVLASSGHENRTYDITGPRSYDTTELAALYAVLGGRSVKAVAVDDPSFIAGMLGSGEHDGHARYGAELVASFGRAVRENHLSACTDMVEKLTGRPATALEIVLQRALEATTA